MAGTKIGELNGPWAFFFKVVLSSYPLLIGWACWVSASQVLDNSFRNEGPRFTAADADSQTRQILLGVEKRLANMEAKMGEMVPSHRLVDYEEYRELLEKVIRIEASVGQSAEALRKLANQKGG